MCQKLELFVSFNLSICIVKSLSIIDDFLNDFSWKKIGDVIGEHHIRMEVFRSLSRPRKTEGL